MRVNEELTATLYYILYHWQGNFRGFGRWAVSTCSPDSASCRGFFLPLNHEESNRNRPQ